MNNISFEACGIWHLTSFLESHLDPRSSKDAHFDFFWAGVAFCLGPDETGPARFGLLGSLVRYMLACEKTQIGVFRFSTMCPVFLQQHFPFSFRRNLEILQNWNQKLSVLLIL